MVLIYAGMGAMLFALLPFGLFGGGVSDSTAWRVAGTLFTLYSGVGLAFFPARSIRMRAEYPSLFPIPLIILQLLLHLSSFFLCIAIVFDLTEYRANVYTMALLLLLVHGSIAFVRTLFYRRSRIVATRLNEVSPDAYQLLAITSG